MRQITLRGMDPEVERTIRRADLDRFLEHEAVELVPIGKITSDRYSRIAAKLKQQGTPIPTNDIWIAAQAMEQGAELITSDQHFKKISGLYIQFSKSQLALKAIFSSFSSRLIDSRLNRVSSPALKVKLKLAHIFCESLFVRSIHS